MAQNGFTHYFYPGFVVGVEWVYASCYDNDPPKSCDTISATIGNRQQ